MSLVSTPSDSEINNILERRRKLIRFHRLLYRKIKDIIGYEEVLNYRISKFADWAKDNLNISRFNSTLYYYVTTIKLKDDDKKIKRLANCLFNSGYVYEISLIDCDYYDKFHNENEAVIWLLAYRATKYYYETSYREIYDRYNLPQYPLLPNMGC